MNEQVQAVLKQISITQRIGIIGAALAAVAMIAVLVMFASKPDYTPAFTNLAAADAGTIESALKGANIAYQLTDAGARSRSRSRSWATPRSRPPTPA
jgi:flagellar M-ring protein FliF